MKLIKLLVMSLLLIATSSHAAIQFLNGSMNTTTWKIWFTWDNSYNVAQPTGFANVDSYDSYYVVITNNIPQLNNATNINMSVPVVKGDTWASVNQRFADTYGSVGSLSRTYNSNILGGSNVYMCMRLGTMAGSFSSKVGCGLLVKAANNLVTCDITGPTAIDHGYVDIANVNGNTASITARIACTGPTSVAIQSSPSASLGNGITSEIRVDGLQYPRTRSLTGPTDINIESKLVATSPVAGNFSGSSVIIIEVL